VLAGLAIVALAAPAGAQENCTARFRLDDAVTLGALQFEVSYPHPDAAFDGSDTSVDCTNTTTALPSYQDDDAGLLTVALLAFGGPGVSGPGTISTCELTSAGPITATDLVVTVIDASDPDANPVSPLPSVSVSLVCDGGTTLPSSTTTTTLPTTEQCIVQVDVTDSALIGSIQVELDYTAADGDFDGSGSGVICSTLVSGALGSYNDDEGLREISVAIIKLNGFATPSPLFECTFLPGTVLPIPNDFDLRLVDAGDPDSQEISPPPVIAITSIECFDPNATTTTTSTTTTTLPPMCGDADYNGAISASDSQRILHAAVGLISECFPTVCDTSGDGNLTVGDAQRVLRYAVGLPSPLTCP
jgi:hypothetical protein